MSVGGYYLYSDTDLKPRYDAYTKNSANSHISYEQYKKVANSPTTRKAFYAANGTKERPTQSYDEFGNPQFSDAELSKMTKEADDKFFSVVDEQAEKSASLGSTSQTAKKASGSISGGDEAYSERVPEREERRRRIIGAAKRKEGL